MRWNLKEGGGKPPARGSRTPIEASDSWVSLHSKAKPLLPKAVESKWSGCGGKDNVLTRGGLPVRCSRPTD